VSIRLHSWFVLLLTSGCATRVFLHPDIANEACARRPVDPSAQGDTPQIITVTNALGRRITGWLFSTPGNHGVVLVGDGNATGIAHTYDYNRFLLHHGFNVLITSYQGYDTNDGPADIHSPTGDVEAFYSFARATFTNQPVAFLAESLSTAVFFSVASRHPEVSCIVLEAMVNPKTVAIAKAHDWWLMYPLYPLTLTVALCIKASVPEDLDVNRALDAKPTVPALFIHHPRDRVTPYRSARKIFDQYSGPKQWIDLSALDSPGHHMTGFHNPELTARVLVFFETHFTTQ
jgi:pimeloyl-ACP methyl ester carboxylesterase